MKVGIVGSGISGISAAWLLSKEDQVEMFEAGDYIGGHTNTVKVSSLDKKKTIGVDTGFIVCNPVTYPNFLAMMEELDVELIRSDMSFSVSKNYGEFEWSGDNLNTVFAQRSNLLPWSGMYRMILDIMRFHDHANALADEADSLVFDDTSKSPDLDHPLCKTSIGQFFRENGYSEFFYENYILPMTACIWSTPTDLAFEKFPILTLVRFMRNHCLLQIGNRPKWRTVNNGSSSYIKNALKNVKVHLNTCIVSLNRLKNEAKGKVTLRDQNGKEHIFDHVILATHSDQALKILGDLATQEEREILGAIKFSKNRAVLHRDESLMPKRKLAWSAWNYLTTSNMASKSNSICLTYWMNRLQSFIDTKEFGQIFVTMNPLFEPKEDTVLDEFHYEHPIYTPETIAAQERLNSIQNKFGISFAGAWTNYGFHEDGCTSGLLAAVSLGAKCPFDIMLNGGHPTHRVPMLSPSYLNLPRYVPKRPTYQTAVTEKSSKPIIVGCFAVLVLISAILIGLGSQ